MLVGLHLEHCPFLAPQLEKSVDRLEKVQRAMKIIRGLENLPYEKRLKKIGLFFLKKRLQYLKHDHKEDEVCLHMEPHYEDK